MSRRVLLSIRPRFAEAILDGTKTYELRRRFPTLDRGTIIYLYSSSPVMAIVGSFVSGEIRREEKAMLWEALKDKFALDHVEFSDYLHGQNEGIALHTTNVTRFRNPISLSQVRSAMNVEAPQSFRYIPAAAQGWLDIHLATPTESLHVQRSSRTLSFA